MCVRASEYECVCVCAAHQFVKKLCERTSNRANPIGTLCVLYMYGRERERESESVSKNSRLSQMYAGESSPLIFIHSHSLSFS